MRLTHKRRETGPASRVQPLEEGQQNAEEELRGWCQEQPGSKKIERAFQTLSSKFKPRSNCTCTSASLLRTPPHLSRSNPIPSTMESTSSIPQAASSVDRHSCVPSFWSPSPLPQFQNGDLRSSFTLPSPLPPPPRLRQACLFPGWVEFLTRCAGLAEHDSRGCLLCGRKGRSMAGSLPPPSPPESTG